MAKIIKKTKKENINIDKTCITCGRDFPPSFKEIVFNKKLEYEKNKIQYYVFKNENGSWSIAEKVSFNILKERYNITEYFHIREFEPK